MLDTKTEESGEGVVGSGQARGEEGVLGQAREEQSDQLGGELEEGRVSLGESLADRKLRFVGGSLR